MTAPRYDEANLAEAAYWNGPGGQRWLNRHNVHDALLRNVGEILLARAAPSDGASILDVGCGCGATSIALAERVAPGGRVLGLDISEPLLARARQVAPTHLPVEFVLGDATTYPFKARTAELLHSRFGVMFFADPVRSFTNMRRGLCEGARVVFSCWREARLNPWLMLPLQAAYRHVPRLPEVGPEDPGPFSFADERRVRRILEGAGFVAVGLEAVELPFDLAGGQGLDAAVDTAINIGPTSRALDGQPADLRAAATDAIRAALAPRASETGVPLPGALWIVSASAP